MQCNLDGQVMRYSRNVPRLYICGAMYRLTLQILALDMPQEASPPPVVQAAAPGWLPA